MLDSYLRPSLLLSSISYACVFDASAGWAAGLDRLALLTNLPVQVEVRPHAAVLPILPRAAPIASEVEAVERKHPSATPSSGEPSLRSSPSRTDVEVGALERRISTLCLVTAQALRANGIPAVILHGGRTVKKQVAVSDQRERERGWV